MAQPLFQTSYCLQVAGEFDQRVQLFKMRRQCLTCIPKQLVARLVGWRVCSVEGASGVEHVALLVELCPRVQVGRTWQLERYSVFL
eukprot:scaffold7327_cov134-Skeletonema_dohrnii-CCMP3373.AAC.5